MSEYLATDPRTAWAWSEYLDTEKPREISDDLARQLLSAIPENDHVEVFAHGVILKGKKAELSEEHRRKKSHLLARTMRRWIELREGKDAPTMLDGPAEGSFTETTSMGIKEPSWTTSYAGAAVKVYIDDRESDLTERLSDGAGFDILRLPDVGGVPAPPDLLKLPAGQVANGPKPFMLVTDWRAAEQFALMHMKDIGFAGARLTGGSRDKGADIVHEEAVAQVKMQGVPVGAPVIQQLRGTRPHLKHHLFYSTSGYTTAAVAEANESAVALFTIDAGGRVSPAGGTARLVEREAGSRQEGPGESVAAYVDDVKFRVSTALTNYGSEESAKRAIKNEPRDGAAISALRYLYCARVRLESGPEVGDGPFKSIINYYRHTELLAAVFCRELGYEYPGRGVLGKKAKSMDDFY